MQLPSPPLLTHPAFNEIWVFSMLMYVEQVFFKKVFKMLITFTVQSCFPGDAECDVFLLLLVALEYSGSAGGGEAFWRGLSVNLVLLLLCPVCQTASHPLPAGRGTKQSGGACAAPSRLFKCGRGMCSIFLDSIYFSGEGHRNLPYLESRHSSLHPTAGDLLTLNCVQLSVGVLSAFPGNVLRDTTSTSSTPEREKCPLFGFWLGSGRFP